MTRDERRALLTLARAEITSIEASIRREQTRQAQLLAELRGERDRGGDQRRIRELEQHASELYAVIGGCRSLLDRTRHKVSLINTAPLEERSRSAATQVVAAAAEPQTAVLIIDSRQAIVRDTTSARTAVLARATRWLRVAEVFLPARIAREEIGDALEDLARYAREDRPSWHILVHAAACAFHAVWHAWADKLSELRKSRG